ncbi:hypothetical protein PT974_09055 [Cladobotryum mycophilum]|uniref:DUF7603 domain-containing protein n=1 Tax=Cladobotryum mycophilum TaxID=491253 RepID=A0ABR0SG45_9HYPO
MESQPAPSGPQSQSHAATSPPTPPPLTTTNTMAIASLISPDSEAASASSDVSLSQHYPPLMPSPPSPSQDNEIINRNRNHNHTHSHTHNHYNHYNNHYYPTPTAPQHSRSQTFDNAIATAPVVVSLPPRFSGPIRRKPVSSTASLLVTPFVPHAPQPAQTISDLPQPDCRFDRPPSIDSPTLYDYPASVRYSLIASQLSGSRSAPTYDDTVLESRNHPAESGVATTTETDSAELSDVFSEYDLLISDLTPDATPNTTSSTKGIDDDDNDNNGDESDNTSDIESLYADNINSNPSPPMFVPKPSPPHLRLEKVDSAIGREEGPRTLIDDSPQLSALGTSPGLNKPLPKSPGQSSPSASFFAWGSPSPSVTEFSSIPSPLLPAKNGLTNDGRRSTKSSFADDTKTDAASNSIRYADTYLSTPSPSSPALSTSHSVTLVDEMEDELKAISSELAASIRREMDLEDLVDRLQEQINNPQAPNKRSSDYFSDSGYSSAKLSDYDQGREEVEKIQRRSEQEKASLRLELMGKVQDERSRRKELDRKIKDLAEKASHVDIAHINSLDANDRIRTLEDTCEDLRRKLSEERESRTNIEDLLSALKGELRDACDERDNLRDEVIPELRARIEGLETEAAEYAGLTYESARMQQQLESLREENSSLRNSIISGPEELSKRLSGGLSRSNSLGPSSMRGPKTPFALTRTDSFKNAAAAAPNDSREDLVQKLKDVELQRDALHSALKSLLERQEFQNREYQKKIRILENERQRLVTNSPRKAGFEKDMSKLRTEINLLRRRAEDALEQKWQVEKGLSGLKMDLDRAEEEIESLRNLLKEKDILIPPSLARSSVSSEVGREPVTSESLENAYKELQNAYAESLERIKQLEEEAGSTEELNQSAQRIDHLASQVQQQLTANTDLRERLSAAVSRGDTDRKANSMRIAEMQERLRHLEDQVISAQTASEERVARHEEEVARIRESHNEQLRRFQIDGRGGTKTSLKSMMSSTSTGFGGPLRPVPTKSFEEEAEMRNLRAKVAELEKALADTEKEMQEVVARMSMAQVEVLNLQEAREAAVRETRRLEQIVKQEQSKGRGGLFFGRS